MDNELEKFKSMLDKRLISEKAYEAKKKDILDLYLIEGVKKWIEQKS